MKPLQKNSAGHRAIAGVLLPRSLADIEKM